MQRLKISIITLLGTLMLGGCMMVSPQLADGIREGQSQYSKGNYFGAERLLTSAISSDPRSPAVAEAYYVRGLTRLKLNRRSLAEQDLQRALRLANRDDLKANVHVCLATLAFEDENWDIAYVHYKAAEGNLTDLSPSDWILFRLACSAQRSGRWDEGKRYFARILREYPDSETAKSARRMLNCEYFTIQTGAYSTPSGASVQVMRLRQVKLPVRTEVININNRSLQGVFVGRYKDYYQATKGLNMVKRVIPDARIVP
jgi:tetratricopeptide (TPR) repeat protein